MDGIAMSMTKNLAMALIVVMSTVIVGAGAGVAATNPTNGSVSPTTVDENTSVDHSFHFEVDSVSADGSADTFYVQLPNAYAGGITINSVSAYNTSNTSETFAVSNTSVVDRDGDGTNEAIKFTINPSSGTSTPVSVDVGATLSHPAVQVNTDYTATASVVDSSNADVTGYTLGTITVTAEETNPSDGGIYWVGQTLYEDNNVSAGEVVTLYKKTDSGKSFVSEYQANSNGVVVLDTSSLSQADYVIQGSNGEHVVSFSLVEQTLSVSVDDANVTNNGQDKTATFDFNSNRVSYDVVVSAENLTNDELLNIFSSATEMNVDDDSEMEVVLETVKDKVDGNFDGIDAGEYTLNFDVTDTDASASTTVSVEKQSDATATFSQSVFKFEVGDTAVIPVELSNTDTAQVNIGGDESNYELVVQVTDGNDDGVVKLNFNSYEAGKSGSPVSTVADKDSVSVTSETTLSSPPLDATDYTVTASVNGDQTGIATLFLQEQSDVSATSYVAPAGENVQSDLKDFTSDDKATSLSEYKNYYTERPNVALQDKLVVELTLGGQVGVLTGTGATAADLVKGSTFAQNHGMYLQIEEKQADTNSQKQKLDVSKGTLYVDGETNTAYVVFDTSDFSNLETDDSYNASFHVTEANAYVDSGNEKTASTDYNPVERTLTINTGDNDKVTVTSSDNQTITADTTVAPGTEVTIRVKSDSSTSPFLMSQTTKVSTEGVATATFDFSSIPAGTNFKVMTVNFDASAEGVVVAPNKAPTAAFSVGQSDIVVGDTVTFDASSSTDDAKVTAYEWDFNGDGQVDKTGKTVTYTFDSAGNYTVSLTVTDADGASDTTQKTVTVEQKKTDDTQNDTTTTTPTPDTDNQTQDNTTTTTPDNNEDQTSAPTPGFGVAVSIVALVGAALLVLRRE